MLKRAALPSGVCLTALLAAPCPAQSPLPDGTSLAGSPSPYTSFVHERLRDLLYLQLVGDELLLEEDELGEPASTEADAPLDDADADAAQASPKPKPRAGAARPAETTPPPAPDPVPQRDGSRVKIVANGVTLEGDEVEFRPETGLYEMKGNPVATRGVDSVRAQRMTLNPRTRQATAEGEVVIRQEGQEFRATRGTYNFDGRQGLADNVETVFGTYYVRAKEIELKPGLVYEGRRVHFSTCPPEHGHYGVYTRLLEVKTGQTLTARSVGIDVLGFRVLTIPRITRSIRESDDNERSGSIYPSIGYSKYTGPYVRREFTLQRSKKLWLDADTQINTWQEPAGGLLFGTPGRLQVTGSFYYRDDSENRSIRNLQVSRLPEVGVVWSQRNNPRPGKLLTHHIYGVGYPEELQDSTKWIAFGELSTGYYRQHHGDRVLGGDSQSKNGGRVRLQGQGVLPAVKLGRISLDGLRFLARQTFYDNGERLTVLGTGIGKQVRAGRWKFRVDRFDQWTMGSTPFIFDNLDLAREWRPRVEFQTRVWSLSYTARLHGETGDLFDQWFSVSKLHHCLQPRLTYRTRQQQFLFEIRIPGISGFSRTPAGEPATTRREDSGAPKISTQHE